MAKPARRSRSRTSSILTSPGWDIALFAAGSGPTKEYAPKAAAAGCVVIDNSSLYRMDPDVPLIVPEVNPDAIDGYKKRNIIANPNCSTAQMVVALKPLHDAAKIKRVVVSTYQSVSGAGKEGMDELFEQSRNIFVGDPAEPKKFTKQIAFNVIPHIDVFLDDGYTKEEWKMVVETKKILDPKIKVTATCVRVPVFVGHSEAINIEFEEEISPRRRSRHPARGARRDAGRQARERRLRHPGRVRRRLRDLRLPRPRGSDRGERPRAVVRVRQSAQGRGAECGADRGAARAAPPQEGVNDPSRFVPKHHYGVETRLEHWRDTTDLPDYKLTDSQKTVDLWMNAIGKLPD
jgi:aspartate-semialdehyde dehydrogenase